MTSKFENFGTKETPEMDIISSPCKVKHGKERDSRFMVPEDSGKSNVRRHSTIPWVFNCGPTNSRGSGHRQNKTLTTNFRRTFKGDRPSSQIIPGISTHVQKYNTTIDLSHLTNDAFSTLDW
ncbi:hypothetical protein LguiA_015633 [Lonicera macranthoides]